MSPRKNPRRRNPYRTRFSTVGSEKGSADAERDPWGFAVKFYTERGNYDFVGNNTPVLFIRDPAGTRDRSPHPYIHKQTPRTETILEPVTKILLGILNWRKKRIQERVRVAHRSETGGQNS